MTIKCQMHVFKTNSFVRRRSTELFRRVITKVGCLQVGAKYTRAHAYTSKIFKSSLIKLWMAVIFGAHAASCSGVILHIGCVCYLIAFQISFSFCSVCANPFLSRIAFHGTQKPALTCKWWACYFAAVATTIRINILLHVWMALAVVCCPSSEFLCSAQTFSATCLDLFGIIYLGTIYYRKSEYRNELTFFDHVLCAKRRRRSEREKVTSNRKSYSRPPTTHLCISLKSNKKCKQTCETMTTQSCSLILWQKTLQFVRRMIGSS